MQLPVDPNISTTMAIRLAIGIWRMSEGLPNLGDLQGYVYTRQQLRITKAENRVLHHFQHSLALSYRAPVVWMDTLLGNADQEVPSLCQDGRDGYASWQCRPRGFIAPPRWSAGPMPFCYVHLDLTRTDIQRFDNVLESSFRTALH